MSVNEIGETYTFLLELRRPDGQVDKIGELKAGWPAESSVPEGMDVQLLVAANLDVEFSSAGRHTFNLVSQEGCCPPVEIPLFVMC